MWYSSGPHKHMLLASTTRDFMWDAKTNSSRNKLGKKINKTSVVELNIPTLFVQMIHFDILAKNLHYKL